MNVISIRAKVQPEKIDETKQAVTEVFAAIHEAKPQGVHYASFQLESEATFVILLGLDGADNPLLTIPAFGLFQEKLKTLLAEPPTQERLQLVGQYNAFEQ